MRGANNYHDTLHTGARIYTGARACDELLYGRLEDLSTRDTRLILSTNLL
jgi:hypothetical protein